MKARIKTIIQNIKSFVKQLPKAAAWAINH